MTDYKERVNVPKHPSLYIGLFYNIVKGILIAVLLWLVIMLTSYYLIGAYYTTPDMKNNRREEYLEGLQSFVTSRYIARENAQEIAEWVRQNPYTYLIVYYDVELPDSSGSLDTDVNNKPGEFTGSRIGETLERRQLASDAASGGYHQIALVGGGSVTVAIAEYTENFFYSTFNIISIVAAALVFILSLVKYIRIIIERIKRLESDVTVVAEIDMSYEITEEGADELTNLSDKVEQMRQSMLHHIKSEQEAREANASLIASISHDLRTPLTVLMGYIEMMKAQVGSDEVMESYIAATESTSLRLKQLADDILKYSLAFGDAEKSVNLEEYDATTLLEQILAEHFLLMNEMGYDIRRERRGDVIKQGSTVRTDAPNLMRIIDNVFSNLRKYADISKPITFSYGVSNGRLYLECINSIRTDTESAESNRIGLKTCVRLGSLIAEKFEYFRDGEYFVCRLVIPIRENNTEEKT